MAFALTFGSGCVTTNVGNTMMTCSEDEPCDCEGIGNCLVECPAGGCDVRCEGTGNCYLSCGGGDCTLTCEGTGNCILEECTGGCVAECEGFGNCICQEGCGEDTDPPMSDAG